MIDKKEITNGKFAVFLTVSFAGGWIPLTIAGIAMRNQNTMAGLILFRFIVVFIPLIAVIVSRLPLKKIGWRPKFGFKHLILSLIGPQILSWIGAALFFLFNRDAYGIGMESLSSLFPAETVKALENAGVTPATLLVSAIIMSLTFMPISQILPSLGEEAGWRGVMYPYLKSRLGPAAGRLIGGALWGIWHWPLIIIGSYFYEGDYFGKPVTGPVMICIALCAFGVIIDYFYEKTGCIWIASLMHSSMNASTLPLMLMLKSGYGHQSILGPNCFGLIGCLPVIILAVILLIWTSLPKKA